MDHQLTGSLSVNFAYFRRVQGGLTVTDNTSVTPADYDPFCVTAPKNANLPNGGGYQVCGLYDVKPAKFGVTTNQVNAASTYDRESTDVWNGFDIGTSMRFKGGGQISGGLSTGRAHKVNSADVDGPQSGAAFNCSSVDVPGGRDYCDLTEPFQTSVKVLGSYPLPWGINVSGTLANVPGQFLQGTFVYRNADIAPSLGRNLSAGANGTVTVNLIKPRTEMLPRNTQIDMKIGKSIRAGRANFEPSFDIVNLLNANGVEAYNNPVNDVYPKPVRIQFGRFVKLNMLVTF